MTRRLSYERSSILNIKNVRFLSESQPQSKHHSILLRRTVALKTTRRRWFSKSLFVATKTGHGGRLLRSLNAAELPVERSNPLRTGWCQTQARVVCIVYCRYARSFGKDAAAVAATESMFQLMEPNGPRGVPLCSCPQRHSSALTVSFTSLRDPPQELCVSDAQ